MNNENGVPRGLKDVCEERFGCDAVRGKLKGDLVHMLEFEEDFANQKSLLQETVERNGGLYQLLPKFSPELK